MYSCKEDSHYWEKHKELQNALYVYLDNNNTDITCAIRFSSGIDCVAVIATSNDEVIMWIGLPPVSNYSIRLTEHACKYFAYKESKNCLTVLTKLQTKLVKNLLRKLLEICFCKALIS